MPKDDQENTMENKKIWTVQLEEDPEMPGELLFTFPMDLLIAAGWAAGDTIAWSQDSLGSWILKKKSDLDK